MTRATVQLSNLQTDREKTLNNIANAYLGLKVLMGMPTQDTLVVTDSVDFNNIKDGVLENLNYKYADRKEYQLAQIGSELREYNIKRYKYTYLPTVSLSSSYSRISQSNKYNFIAGTAKWFPASTIGLNIAVPIFDGFAKDARIKQAKIQLQQSQNDMEALGLSIDREVQTARRW